MLNKLFQPIIRFVHAQFNLKQGIIKATFRRSGNVNLFCNKLLQNANQRCQTLIFVMDFIQFILKL